MRVPQDVSLVCDDPDPAFAWQVPTVAHIRWQAEPCVRRLVRWAENTAAGRADQRKSLAKAEFVGGGTIGPAPPTARGAK